MSLPLNKLPCLASRAKFQHSNLANTTIRIKAMHDLRDGLANIKFVEKEEPTLDNGKTFWLQDPYNWYVAVVLVVRDVIQKFCLKNSQKWKLSELKVG